MTDGSDQINCESSPTNEGQGADLRNMTVEQRFAMVWQLTVDEWAKKGIDVTNMPMRKDVERVIRNGPNHDDIAEA
jgi:hypothetical protein